MADLEAQEAIQMELNFSNQFEEMAGKEFKKALDMILKGVVQVGGDSKLANQVMTLIGKTIKGVKSFSD